MSTLRNSSELLESAALLKRLLSGDREDKTPEGDLIFHVRPDDAVREVPEPLFSIRPQPETPPLPVEDQPAADLPFDHLDRLEETERLGIGEFRDNKLEDILSDMCRRSGMIGALLADINGLPVAAYRSPVENEVFAAFASVLGETMDKVGYFLDQHDANYIAVDINYADKAVVKKFLIDDAIFYLIVIVPKHINERGEMDYTIERLNNVLSLH